MNDPAPPPSPDYLMPALRWLARGARGSLAAAFSQTGLNVALTVASAIGLAGGVPVIAPYLKIPAIVFPIPAAGGLSRVIVVYESSWAITPGQTAAILSDTTRAYLDSAVPKDASGRPAWRVWDKETDRSYEPIEWQDAYNRAAGACAGKIPQVVAFDAAGNASAFPVPETPEALINQLKKYAGK